jgi:hypothetical protein
LEQVSDVLRQRWDKRAAADTQVVPAAAERIAEDRLAFGNQLECPLEGKPVALACRAGLDMESRRLAEKHWVVVGLAMAFFDQNEKNHRPQRFRTSAVSNYLDSSLFLDSSQ